MTGFNSVYSVKKELSKEQFLRKVLVKLACHKDTPNDVCNATFSDVRESTKEVILCSAHVESDYSASVGYDRKEEYWDKKKEIEYVNGKKYERLVDVKKTRTVTDWHPHSGHIGGNAVCLAFNDDNYRFAMDEHYRLMPIIKSIKDDSIVEEDKSVAEVSYGGLESVKKNCQFLVELGINYPGNHHKDERSSATVDVKTIKCIRVPYYEVEFTYNGQKYHASGLACGDPNAETELPPNNVDIQAMVEQEAKPYKAALICGWLGFVVGTVLVVILSGINGVTWPVIFVPILFIIAVALHRRGNKKYNALMKQLRDDNKKLKLNNLVSALNSKGYYGLTPDELSYFK